MPKQGEIGLLNDPIAKELLCSRIPARLAYVWPDGGIGPLACASEAYLVQIFAYALVTLQRAYHASWCSALVPGSNRRIARASLRAGLRIAESFIVAADGSPPALSAYVGRHRLLL